MIRDIVSTLDQEFLDHCDAAIAEGKHRAKVYAAIQEPRRWRDGKGVVHELRGRVAYNVSMTSTVVWTPACGYRYSSSRQCSPGTTVTCLACTSAAPTTYRCLHCAHREFEHEGGDCTGCENLRHINRPAVSQHAFVPNYTNPVAFDEVEYVSISP